jgi:hypothetical protein
MPGKRGALQELVKILMTRLDLVALAFLPAVCA